MKCLICRVEINKPIMLGETASKAWAKKNGYDGYQWNELRKRILETFPNALPELIDESPNWGKDYAMFFTCMKHTGKEFDAMGESAEDNQDKEDD